MVSFKLRTKPDLTLREIHLILQRMYLTVTVGSGVDELTEEEKLIWTDEVDHVELKMEGSNKNDSKQN